MSKEKEKVKIKVLESNPKIEEIIKDYPKSLTVQPRTLFENQLRKHLLKHKIK